MDIRFLEPEDYHQIKIMYNVHFKDMEYPDFWNNFQCVYVVHKENKIIAVGGLRPMAEAIVLTEQSESIRTRRDALMHIYNALTYSAKKLKYNSMYAFTYDDNYSRHLVERMGFQPVKESKLLVLEL
jgi:N-acetylglutamate synthase-like GNAT family acetyltransferase